MTRQEIASILAGRAPGAMLTLSMVRPAKLRAAFKGQDISKASQFAMQLASYANRAPVKQAVGEGERDAPTTPAWVVNVEREANGLTFWHKADGTQYLALPRFGDKARAQWFKDGQPVELEDIKHMLLASEYAERNTKAEVEDKGQAMFNIVTLDNITQIA